MIDLIQLCIGIAVFVIGTGVCFLWIAFILDRISNTLTRIHRILRYRKYNQPLASKPVPVVTPVTPIESSPHIGPTKSIDIFTLAELKEKSREE
jgi:hypothetical protein